MFSVRTSVQYNAALYEYSQKLTSSKLSIPQVSLPLAQHRKVKQFKFSGNVRYVASYAPQRSRTVLPLWRVAGNILFTGRVLC